MTNRERMISEIAEKLQTDNEFAYRISFVYGHDILFKYCDALKSNKCLNEKAECEKCLKDWLDTEVKNDDRI